MSRKSSEATQPAPHSWDTEHWPSHVWPHSGMRARYVVRTFRNELLLAGAMARVGRELVFIGVDYNRWLQTRRSKAAASKFTVPANRTGGQAA